MEMVNAQAKDYNLGKWGRKKKSMKAKKEKRTRQLDKGE